MDDILQWMVFFGKLLIFCSLISEWPPIKLDKVTFKSVNWTASKKFPTNSFVPKSRRKEVFQIILPFKIISLFTRRELESSTPPIAILVSVFTPVAIIEQNINARGRDNGGECKLRSYQVGTDRVTGALRISPIGARAEICYAS